MASYPQSFGKSYWSDPILVVYETYLETMGFRMRLSDGLWQQLERVKTPRGYGYNQELCEREAGIICKFCQFNGQIISKHFVSP